MLSILRSAVFVLMLVVLPVVSYAQSVPIIVPTSDVPATCEEDFWNVLKGRAEMEASREVIQNQNLIARPDSILMLTCFDRQMGHLGRYADNDFPGEPQQSLDETESLGGIFNRLLVVMIREALGDVDPHLAGGYLPSPAPSFSFVKGGQLKHLLEILIWDNMVENVSDIANAADSLRLGLGICGKDFYLEDNLFEGAQLGGRSDQYVLMPHRLPNASFDGCALMNQLWNEARCMNFQRDVNATVVRNNDGFHRFDEYVATEAADDDYRVYPGMCRANMSNMSTTDIACHFIEHGTPILPATATDWISFILSMTGPGARPWTMEGGPPTYWADMETAATVGVDMPGGIDGVLPRNELFRSATAAECSAIQPVPTGLVVKDDSGGTYRDAVCPAAGCYFRPNPSAGNGYGSCER